MNNTQLESQLCLLLSEPENEVVEFKESNKQFSTEKIGQYFSALSNEANLRGKEYAWLIFGIKDIDRSIIGTTVLHTT